MPPVHLDGIDSVTEENLNRMVLELQPLVEQAGGRPFDRVPYARLGRAADLEGILEAEFLTFMGSIYPDTPDWVQREMARSARASAPGVIGKYGVHTGVLYLAPDAISRIVEGDEALDSEDFDGIARLVMAHEMAHALQQEVASLDETLGSLRDRDHFDGLRGATEGHANLVEKRVAEKLGLQALEAALNRTQGWSEAGPELPATVGLWSLYGQGRVFVEWHWDQGGAEQAWRVVREPPAATSMLFRPHTYAPRLEDYEPHAELTAGVLEVLSEGSWVSVPSHVSEVRLRTALFGSDGAEVDAVLGHIDGFSLSGTRRDRGAEIQWLRFSDASWRQRFEALALAHEPGDGSTEVTPHDLAPGARRRRISPAVDGVQLEVNELWVPRGNQLLVIQTVGFRPGRRLDEAARLLLERRGP